MCKSFTWSILRFSWFLWQLIHWFRWDSSTLSWDKARVFMALILCISRPSVHPLLIHVVHSMHNTCMLLIYQNQETLHRSRNHTEGQCWLPLGLLLYCVLLYKLMNIQTTIACLYDSTQYIKRLRASQDCRAPGPLWPQASKQLGGHGLPCPLLPIPMHHINIIICHCWLPCACLNYTPPSACIVIYHEYLCTCASPIHYHIVLVLILVLIVRAMTSMAPPPVAMPMSTVYCRNGKLCILKVMCP